MNILENDVENQGNVDEDSDIIASKMIGRSLFCINLAPVSDEQQIVECLVVTFASNYSGLSILSTSQNGLSTQRTDNYRAFH